MEIWKYSHTTKIGCKKSKEIKYYYSSEGRQKKIWYNGKIEIKTPTHKGKNGERIYVTIAKMFPEICGEYFEGCEIDHINTNRFDNRAINLRCCTPKENMNNELTKQHCKEAMYKRIELGVYDETSNKLKGRIPWNKGLIGEDNPIYGIKRSIETRKKMSEAAKKRKPNMLGHKFSKEHNEKMRLSKLGKHRIWDDETHTKYHYE